MCYYYRLNVRFRSGLLISSSEIGFIVATLLTGHFFSRAHRPRVLAVCSVSIALASFLATLPYFMDINYKLHRRNTVSLTPK